MPRTPAADRPALTRETIIDAATRLADEHGIESVTMRRVGAEVGIEAMSLYHHVRDKSSLVGGMVDAVVDELNERIPPPGDEARDDWQGTLRQRILSARQVMLAHPWAPAVMEQRKGIGPGLVSYYEGVLATLRAGGFSYQLAHRALHALGSRAMGFTQEMFAPQAPATDGPDEAEQMVAALAEQAPHLVAMIADGLHQEVEGGLGWCDDQSEFEFALDLLLDGLQARLDAESRGGRTA